METGRSSILALHLTRAGADRIKELVAGAPLAELSGLESSLEEFERKAVQLEPEILLVEMESGHEGLKDLLERLRRSLPRAAVIAVSQSQAAEEILAAMRLGVREYLAWSTTGPALNEAVLRFKLQAETAGRPSAPLLAVYGVKGGVGASQLAVNLAWALSQDLGLRVALSDLDLVSGDLALLLDLSPKRTLLDVTHNFDRLDGLLLDSLLTEVAPGLRLLASPADPVSAEEIGPEHLGRALDHLVNAHAMVVADLPSRIDQAALMALDRAATVLVLVEPSLPGLKAARRFLGLSQRLGHDQEKIQLLVTRFDARGALRAKEVERVLGQKPLLWLPEAGGLLMEAANAGAPALKMKPSAPWSKKVAKLAAWLAQGLGEK